MRVHFGDFALDDETRQLFRGGREVHLVPKAFDLLVLLLAHRPRVVSKTAMRDTLWPSTFISESGLATTVNAVRQALGDDARRPRFVRTVRGFGYAFCAEAGESSRVSRAGKPRLILEGREIALAEGENLLGRAEDAAAWIDAETVSRRHARIVVSGGRAMLEDLGSKNGTFLKGEKVSAAVALSDGDEIWVGRVPVVFRVLRARSTRTARKPTGARRTS
jgi:DNA-binding winged helix-turn-helix (wHTH) protein